VSDQHIPATEARSPLRDYLAVLWLRKWTILSVAALVIGGTIALTYRQAPVYRSETRVLVEAVSLSSEAPGPGQKPNMETEKQIVASSQVAARVVENLELDEGPRMLLPNLTVEVVQGTEIMLISYESSDPKTSQELAQGFASGYLRFRRQQVLEDLKSASAGIRDQIEAVKLDIQDAEEELTTQPEGSVERGNTEAKLGSLNSQLAAYETDLNDLLQAHEVQVGDVIEPAVRPIEPVSPDPVRNGILAIVAGLLLGIGLAFLRERLDDRLRGRGDLEEHVGAPVLAVIPKVGSWRKKTATPVVTLSEPRSATSEAYRTLRTSLLFAAAQREAKSILVTSPHAGEGKTVTSVNLAVALAQAHKRVLLVSADLRKPRLHRFFGISNELGLTSVLIGEAKPWEIVVDVNLEHLKVVPSGPVPGNPAELLGSEAMGSLLTGFREVADFVIIDSAPALVVADALTLAPFIDAALFVADAQRTTRAAVLHGRTQLEQVNANVIGAVLNNFDPSKARTSPYYYSYHYAYKYQEASRPGRLLRGRAREETPLPVGPRITGFEGARGPDATELDDTDGGPDEPVSDGLGQLWDVESPPEETESGSTSARLRRRR
jgi:succinoglycan biosynthesis transport protein ExoP